MNPNDVLNDAKNDLKSVKKPEDAFKLAWYYPLIAAVLLAICKGLLLANTTISILIVLVGAGLGIWTLVQKSNGKPNPLKASWGYFIIPAASIVAILIVPQFFGWVIGALILWAIIAFLMTKPWEKLDNKQI